jgi:holo-[acyl-carrier protein] synthase
MILRTGIDLVEIDRLVKIRPSLRVRFLQRVFTDQEVEECQDSNERLAGRFAVKEAVSKTLGCGIGPVRWKDIEVLRAENGEPVLHLAGNAALRAQALGLTTWSISITHTRTHAAAVAVALGPEVLADGAAGK